MYIFFMFRFLKCLKCSNDGASAIYGDCSGCNVKTLCIVTGIVEEDIIYASFTSQVIYTFIQ